MRPRRGWLAAALVLAAVAAVFVRVRRALPTPDGGARAAPLPPLRPPMAQRAYDFVYESREVISLDLARDLSDRSAPRVFAGSAGLEGRLTLDPARSDRPDRDRYALRITSLRRHEYTVTSRPLIADDAAARRLFDDAMVVLDLAPDGALDAVTVRDGDAPLAQQILRNLALEIAHQRRDAAQWETDTVAPAGLARDRYRTLRRDGVETLLRRERGAYARFDVAPAARVAQSVDGRWDFTLAPDGALRTLVGREVLSVGEAQRPMLQRVMRVELHLAHAIANVAPVDTSRATVRLRPEEPPRSPSLERSMLLQECDGLTAATLRELIATFGDAGRLPDHENLFRRAVALLKLDAAVAESLRPLFEDPRATRLRRGFLLDLLTHAQTPEAQAVMTRLLRAAASDDGHRDEYLRRVALLAHPGDEAVAITRDALARDDLRASTGAVAGALSARLAEEGRGADARDLNDRVVRALEAASPRETPALVLGLGAARRDENLPLLERYAADAQPAVRAAAAQAIAMQAPTAQTTARLVAMTTDGSVVVRDQALDGLGARPLDDGTLAALAERVRAGAIPATSYRSLLEALRGSIEAHPSGVAACCRAMIARNIDVGEDRAEAYAMLARCEAAAR